MKNFTIMLLLATALLAGCKKEDPAPKTLVSISVYKTIFDDYGKISTASTDGESGIIVYIYKDLAGYLNNLPVASSISTKGINAASAEFEFSRSEFPKIDSLYVRAVKENLNSERYYQYKNKTKDPKIYFVDMFGKSSSDIYVSTTPTKLRLQVLDGGTKVQGATVYLYASESNYLSKDKQKSFVTLITTTDANGEIEYTGLEPRQYWFQVYKGSKNNDITTFKTAQALPDDANITNTIQVGIK
jgi:hypothetical protein